MKYRKTMKTLFLSFGFILLFLACQSGTESGRPGMVMDSKEMTPAYDESQSSGGSQAQAPELEIRDQKIIRNGTINIKVGDALKTKAEVDAILKKHKAYVGNEQLDNTDYQASYHLQIRVPADNLDALVADLEAMDGTVTYKSINARDVTEEYIDLETRLTNKRSYLNQYRELLKTARTIEDILKVREQIRVLEEEIESAEGRLKYLSNQVSLSTLDLTLTQEKDYVYRPDRKINFLERLKESVSAGWYGFIEFCLVVLGLWPFWLVCFVLIWILRRYNRRKKQNMPPVKPT